MRHATFALKTLLPAAAFAVAAFVAHPAHAATATETNSDTGSGSVNTNTTEVNQSSTVYVCNDADLYNKVVTAANTGGNSASGGDATITTGDVTSSTSVSNEANTTNISGAGSGSGSSVTLTNSGTGAGSVNDNSAGVDDSSTVNVHNDADIHNKVVTATNTGDNEVGSEQYIGEDGDDSSAAITTGDITVNVTIDNVANKVVIQTLGPGGFTIVLTNSGTGDGSVNTNSADADGSNTITIHNDADVYNRVLVLANTGGNACYATSCTITTGDINVSVMIHNLVNAVTIALGNQPAPGLGGGPTQTSTTAGLGAGTGVVLAAATTTSGLGGGALAPTGANSLLLALALALILVLGLIAARRRQENTVWIK